MSKLRLMGLMGLITTAIFIAIIGTAQGPPAQFITLSGVNPEELACVNVKLQLPNGTPNISAEQAGETAKANSPFGLPVQEAVLAKLVRDGPADLAYRDNLVWAVVLSDGAVHEWDGPGGPPGSVRPPIPFTYDLVLVDALTGKFLLAMNGPINPQFVASSCPS